MVSAPNPRLGDAVRWTVLPSRRVALAEIGKDQYFAALVLPGDFLQAGTGDRRDARQTCAGDRRGTDQPGIRGLRGDVLPDGGDDRSRAGLRCDQPAALGLPHEQRCDPDPTAA